MIPYDLVYLRPAGAGEAVHLFEQARRDGLDPAYYAGGTETLSFIRHNRIRPRALIDIKEISECREAVRKGNQLVFGAALSLNEVVDTGFFPLLSTTCRRIADHTVRNRLALGGNICGRLPYREAVLPLLAAEAEVEIAGPAGSRREPLAGRFHKRLRLEPGELLLRVLVPEEAAGAPWFHRRRQRGTRVDYPLLTCCVLEVSRTIRLAIGGACGYPVRDRQVEKVLNDPSLHGRDRIEKTVAPFASRIRGDFRASAEYRRFLLARVLEEALAEFGRGEGI
jgi:CO/xanthine dehydrogenase FAD-binding subunit